MGDYTDGSGWAKLDATSARELAAVIATFPPSKAEAWSSVLLCMFSTMDQRGVTRVGMRTLAEMAGVSFKVVRGLIERLERDEVVIPLGGGNGHYEARTFSWLCPKKRHKGTPVPSKGHTLCPETRRKGTHDCPETHRKGTQQNTEYSEWGKHHSDAPPRLAPVAEAPAPAPTPPPPQVPLPPPPPPPRGDC